MIIVIIIICFCQCDCILIIKTNVIYTDENLSSGTLKCKPAHPVQSKRPDLLIISKPVDFVAERSEKRDKYLDLAGSGC